MYKFGTDGIRDRAEMFSPEFLTKIVRGLVEYGGENIKVFLAGDTRESTSCILQDLAEACESYGLEHAVAGVLPTPAINYCFYEMGFDFAIDVTASHNPVADNGIKIFERGADQGAKLSEAGRAAVEKSLAEELIYTPIGVLDREELHEEALGMYVQHLVEYVGEADFSGLHIGMDCANGATSVVEARVFEQLGARVELINCCKNYNTAINLNCGSTHLEALQELVVREGLDFGVAFDGDGDRCMAVDAEGHEVDGDQMLAFLAEYLELGAVVTTVMANQGLLNWASENNVHAEVTAVGDPNVVAAMAEHGIDIGSEQNGHVILPGLTSGDGMLTALVVAKAVAGTGKTLSELASVVTKFPQVIVNMDATPAQKSSLATSDAAKDILAQFDEKVKGVAGRLLVRPSGTENIIRITMWGDDAERIASLAEELKNKLGEIL